MRLAVATLVLLLTACAPAAAPQQPSAPQDPAFKVGLVTDVGKIDDKSFNQSAWEGVQQAQKDLNAQTKFLETTDPKDYARNIDLFVQDNYNVIVTVGFALGQATQAAAEKNKQVRFIGVDQFQEKAVDNVAGLIFPEDKAGYLAGSLAALMSAKPAVGQVLGTPIVPPVEAFGVGYVKGARDARAGIRVLSACHPGGLAKGFADPDWGKSTALQMLDQGAGVIFGAGGQTGNGALLAVAERKDGGVLAIGVDSDQYQTLPQARPVLLSSAMKLIAPGVLGLIKAAKDGSFKGGNAVGEVGLAPYHDLEAKVPADVKRRIEQLQSDVKAGKVDTGWANKPTSNCPTSQ